MPIPPLTLSRSFKNARPWLQACPMAILAAMLAATFTPAPAQSTTPPPPKPARKDLPIDPDKTGAVRDSASASIFVTVRSKSKPVAGASVMATNPDGTLASTCETDSAGHCHLSLSAGEYVFTAAAQAGTSRLTTTFDDRGGTLVLELNK